MSDKKTKPTRLEKWMMAITFAEADEHDTALEMMGQKPAKREQKSTSRKKEARIDQRPDLRV